MMIFNFEGDAWKMIMFAKFKMQLRNYADFLNNFEPILES